MAAYSATKAGLIGLVKSLAKDYAESGVTINALAPAVIRTPLVDALPEATVTYMTDKIPMRRCGELSGGAGLHRLDRLAGLQLHHRFHLRSQRRPGDLLNLARGIE